MNLAEKYPYRVGPEPIPVEDSLDLQTRRSVGRQAASRDESPSADDRDASLSLPRRKIMRSIRE